VRTEQHAARETLDLRTVLSALRALGQGDFSVRLPLNLGGVGGEIAGAFNALAAMSETMAAEVNRAQVAVTKLGTVVGPDNQLSVHAGMPAASGVWNNLIESVKRLVILVQQSHSSIEELQRQEAELTKANDALERNATVWQESEVVLRQQSEELQDTNRGLREEARHLYEQVRQVQHTNQEMQLARAALEEQAERLGLTSRHKSEFLANMSHELRTPLNSLLILARLLRDNALGNLTLKQLEYVQTIYAAGNDLLGLVNDILDLAKVESGTVTVNIGGEQFSSFRDYVEREFRQLARERGLVFSISIDQDLPPQIHTDAMRLQQILRNLLANAFKFTREGSVTLQVTMALSGWTPGHGTLDKAGHVVVFSVVDTGIGIPLDKQQVIFEAFQQADRNVSHQFGGTGLGLSISRELARLLGGEICVESNLSGSKFSLFLPLDGHLVNSEKAWRAEQKRADQACVVHKRRATDLRDCDNPQRREPWLAGRKALIVDDDARNIFALSSALEQHGVIVFSANTGWGGIEALKSNPGIDIVLMDLMMPERDGYDTIRLIRTLENFKSIPIIGVTARAMQGDREKCIQAGASDYIAKPVNIGQLVSVMRSWLAA